MKIYISSTYMDLRAHRQAVAQVLRQMGHTPVLMETYVAEDRRPLGKCLSDVGEAEAYVGIFAWRYGYVDKSLKGKKAPAGLPAGVKPGVTSITEAEYRRSRQLEIPRLIFLAADDAPWPPELIDAVSGEKDDASGIRRLRDELARERLVSFFSTPEQLASLVSAAVYRVEVEQQLDILALSGRLELHGPLMNPERPDREEPYDITSTTMMAIREAIAQAADSQLLRVNLGTGRNWWSTRLYLLAAMACEFTEVRQVAFLDGKERLFGVATPAAIRDRLMRRHPEIQLYEADLADPEVLPGLDAHSRQAQIWQEVMTAAGGESEVKAWVRKQVLRVWLGDELVEKRVEWAADPDDRRGLLRALDRILEWPHHLVPLERGGRFFHLVDRDALTSGIARRLVRDRLGRG